MKQKIIFLASTAESLINFRLALMKEFLQRDFSVIAMAPENKEVALQLSNLGIQFVSYQLARNGRNPFKDIFSFIGLFTLIRKQQANYIFSYTIKPVIYGSLAAKLARIPNIYSMITGAGYAFSNQSRISNLIGFIAKKLFTFTLKFNNKIFFQNPDDANFFIQNKMISSYKKTVVVNGSGVDVLFYHYTALPKEVSFLMIARLLYDKGIREYVESARIIKNEFPHISFKIAGWIDSNPNAITEKELTQWTKSGLIEYLGKLTDVRESIANSAIYVLPSYSEGTPRTVLEAMAMGRPIITTTAPGCKETVIPGENGFLVPPRNVEALCTALRYFIQQPEKMVSMGKKSREIAIEKYDVNKVNRHILEEMNIAW